MDELKKQVRNPWAALVVGLIVGALFGLVVLGWGLFPVEWTDAAPSDLNATYQQQWLQMAIVEYGYTGDQALAVQRYDALGEEKTVALIDVGNNLGAATPDLYAEYVMAVEPESVTSIVMGTPPAPSGEAAPSQGFTFLSFLPILCGIAVAVIAAIGIFFILKRLGARQPKETLAEPVAEEVIPEQAPAQPTTEPPLGHFMSTYELGDDLYDDSNSIDSPQGEFLGECGAGISETIGVGDPKKVTAIEVWLFDKNDIQTVTKVIMSTHAFNDEAIRTRLAAKGEPVLATPGAEIILETQSLQMVAKISDMTFGEGPLPPESFFEKITLELAVWPKSS
jgi:hypothetical protein